MLPMTYLITKSFIVIFDLLDKKADLNNNK